MTLRNFVSLVAVLSLIVAASPAMSQTKGGNAKDKKAISKVLKFQKAGKHKKALKLLNKHFKKGLPIGAKRLKAKSLAATGKAAAGFQLLADIPTNTVGDISSLRKDITAIGATLPPMVLKVKVNPTAASISVDGVKQTVSGRAGLIKILPGYRRISVSHPGYSPYFSRVFVGLKKTRYISVTLKALSGTLLIIVDGDGLAMRFGKKTVLLKRSRNSIIVPAGERTVVIEDNAGKQLHRATVTVSGGGTATVTFHQFGMVKTSGPKTTIELAKAEGKLGTRAPTLKLTPGNHLVVIRKPGFQPITGTVNVQAGRSAMVTNALEPLPDRSTLRMISLIGAGIGLALVATSAILEMTLDESEGTVDIIKFSMAGVGGALFVTGGVLYKWSDASTEPDPAKKTLQIRVGAVPLRNGAMITAGAQF